MADVGFDAVVLDIIGSGNTAVTVNPTVAANSDRELILFVFAGDLAQGVVTNVSGHGGTWYLVGGTDGNGTFRGSCWRNDNPDVGAGVITATFAGTITTSAQAICFSLYNVNPSTPISDYAGVSTGSLVIPTSLGDMCVTATTNNFDTPAVTGDTTTEDLANFGVLGYGAAHFAGAGTVTFAWTQLGTGIALALNVKHTSSGPAPSFVTSRQTIPVPGPRRTMIITG